MGIARIASADEFQLTALGSFPLSRACTEGRSTEDRVFITQDAGAATPLPRPTELQNADLWK
jgi:hypothetical protein